MNCNLTMAHGQPLPNFITLDVNVCLQRFRVYKGNIVHGVTNILNIYSNICTYRPLL